MLVSFVFGFFPMGHEFNILKDVFLRLRASFILLLTAAYCKHRVLLLKNKVTLALWGQKPDLLFLVFCRCSCVNHYTFGHSLYRAVFK